MVSDWQVHYIYIVWAHTQKSNASNTLGKHLSGKWIHKARKKWARVMKRELGCGEMGKFREHKQRRPLFKAALAYWPLVVWPAVCDVPWSGSLVKKPRTLLTFARVTPHCSSNPPSRRLPHQTQAPRQSKARALHPPAGAPPRSVIMRGIVLELIVCVLMPPSLPKPAPAHTHHTHTALILPFSTTGSQERMLLIMNFNRITRSLAICCLGYWRD